MAAKEHKLHNKGIRESSSYTKLNKHGKRKKLIKGNGEYLYYESISEIITNCKISDLNGLYRSRQSEASAGKCLAGLCDKRTRS
jgi:hypothetical protein